MFYKMQTNVQPCYQNRNDESWHDLAKVKKFLQQVSFKICVIIEMIKKNQDYFSICELSTSEASLQQSRVEDFRKQEKCKAMKKLKKMEEALARAKQENNELKMHQQMLFQQLQEKKYILKQKNTKFAIEDYRTKSGTTDKNCTQLQDFSFKATHKANKGSLLHKGSSSNTIGYKYSQRYCTVMQSPKDQSPSRQVDFSTNDTFSKKSYPYSQLAHPQKCHSKESSRNLACNKTQRKIQYKENYNSKRPQEKSSIGLVSIEDIWNEQTSFSSSKYWKSTAKTIID